MTTNVSKSWWQQYREAVRRSRYQELLMLLHGQQETAQRLINLEKTKHPGHLESWYLDKVIYDLRREA